MIRTYYGMSLNLWKAAVLRDRNAFGKEVKMNTYAKITALYERLSIGDEQRGGEEKHDVKPSLSQAVRFKQLKKDGKLTPEIVDRILAESKESPVGEETTRLKYRRYFPPDYSPKQVEAVIIELLRSWHKSHFAQI